MGSAEICAESPEMVGNAGIWDEMNAIRDEMRACK